MVIAVGGSKSKKMFESIRLTMKSYFDILDLHYVSNLFVNRVNDDGDIKKHPTAMKEAHRLGRELITVVTLPLNKPIDIELA